MDTDSKSSAPEHPFTLAIDVGGTGLKASVLSKDGTMVADRVKIATSYPMPPDGDNGLVAALTKLVKPLPEADRVSCGFPGMVRSGHVLSAPHFVLKKGPGTAVDPALFKAWSDFDLATALTASLGKPTKVANDADVQGAAVVEGKGLELVITLGTGFGTALFMDGQLLPHMELAHHPFHKEETYNEALGELARKNEGDKHWNKRVREAVACLDALFFFDHLYIGGGNARAVDRDELGDVLERTTVVDNTAGILGGIKLWDGPHIGV
ncbi:MAG TPA: ROK family protein [Acidimicrobiales bacterium]|nr:ROK family protein [Acidimicrobiales bacterium]